MNIYMKRTLLPMRSSVTTFYANKPNHFPISLVASTSSRLRLYSSDGNGSNLTHTQKTNSSVDAEEINNPGNFPNHCIQFLSFSTYPLFG